MVVVVCVVILLDLDPGSGSVLVYLPSFRRLSSASLVMVACVSVCCVRVVGLVWLYACVWYGVCLVLVVLCIR